MLLLLLSVKKISWINKRHHIMVRHCLCKDLEAGIKIVDENRRRGRSVHLVVHSDCSVPDLPWSRFLTETRIVKRKACSWAVYV